MSTFIKVVEYWVPGADRSLLEYGGGLYGQATRFGAVSKDLCFGLGEGLPGQAWLAGHPVVLKEFEGSYFRRTAAAQAAGLTCGIAVPIFAGDFLTSVLVIFCGDGDDSTAGAIELWQNDPMVSRDMNLVDGYYGATSEAFEFISRNTSFRQGTGLPGMAWESQAPVFMPDLGRSAGFLRGDSAVKVGINRGFAVPCSTLGASTYVMAFLSALATPLTRRFEVWTPTPDRSALKCSGGFCESAGTLAAGEADHVLARGQGCVGMAALTGVPSVNELIDTEPSFVAAAAASAGLKSMIAIPLLRGGRLTSVVAWYF